MISFRSDYDSTLVNVQDNIKAMEFDLSRYIGEVTEHLNKVCEDKKWNIIFL